MIKMMIAVNSKDEGKRLLEFFGQKPDIEVVGVEYDGQGAYDRILFLKPDIVLMKMILPEVDGLGIMEKVSVILEVTKRPRLLGTELLWRIMILQF